MDEINKGLRRVADGFAELELRKTIVGLNLGAVAVHSSKKCGLTLIGYGLCQDFNHVEQISILGEDRSIRC